MARGPLGTMYFGEHINRLPETEERWDYYSKKSGPELQKIMNADLQKIHEEIYDEEKEFKDATDLTLLVKRIEHFLPMLWRARTSHGTSDIDHLARWAHDALYSFIYSLERFENVELTIIKEDRNDEKYLKEGNISLYLKGYQYGCHIRGSEYYIIVELQKKLAVLMESMRKLEKAVKADPKPIQEIIAKLMKIFKDLEQLFAKEKKLSYDELSYVKIFRKIGLMK